MPRIKLAAADLPLGQRLFGGLRYPLTGAALATCAALALCRYVAILPGVFGMPYMGLVVSVILWAATWGYAIDCMAHTADGYAEPPEVTVENYAGSPRTLLLVHIGLILILVAIALLAPNALWPALLMAAFLLPALDMSLALDGSTEVALNPATWVRIIRRFGAAYFIPVLANLALAILVSLAYEGATRLPALLVAPIYGFACTYLVLLDFHWMGLLIWHYRERFGMQPEGSRLANALRQDADDGLVRECEVLAQTDPEEAAIRLRDRIDARTAPAAVHNMFRMLLRRLHRDDLLLKHGQTWIAQLCTGGEDRRALGIVQECREIDPHFLPDNPAHTAALAKTAARVGMHELGSYLATGFMQRWPHHEDVPAIMLLATSN